MTIVAFTPEEPKLELNEEALSVHGLELHGSVVELAHELDLKSNPQELAPFLRQVVETGAVVVAHGQRRAEVDAITHQIDRLIGSTTENTEKLPTALQEQLNEHLEALAGALAAHFDPGRTSSVQQQLKELVKGASSEQVQALLRELLGSGGPLSASNRQVASQLKLVLGSNQDVVAKVTSLVERIEAREQLAEQHERSSHKGIPFEEVIEQELNSIHPRLGDNVRCVKSETGVVPGSAAGDFVVALDPNHTRGRELRVVVEAKTGKLSGPEARRELEEAIKNREADAGILVFDGVKDAPLNGRHYMAYPDGRIACVLKPGGERLAFEVACAQARLSALATLANDGVVEPKWLFAQSERLCTLIEEAGKIKRNTAAARKRLDAVDDTYEHLREEALAILDEIKHKLD